MTTEMIVSNLGNLLPEALKYSQNANAFLTNGYVSAASNVYFNAFRFAEGILIKEDIGQGYAYSFLNGLRIYSLKDKTLLVDKSYHCCYYSKEKVFEEAKRLLLNLISDAAAQANYYVDPREAEKIVNRILTEAFQKSQLEIANTQFSNLRQLQ